MTNLLELQDVAVAAQIDGVHVPVLRQISLQLAQRRILGIVGESGAGKTMVGRAIAQLLPPGFAITGGTITFAGENLLSMRARRRRMLLGRAISFIPQAPLSALNPMLTIGQQFAEHLSRLGIGSRGERRERALAMLAAAQLANPSPLLRNYPHELSGGMCQRVLIALAFASEPRLIIADEPTTALDVTVQVRILELIREMQQRHGTALIFITHDLRLAAQLCDDLAVMYAGRVVEQGPAQAVLSFPAHPYTQCLKLATPAMRAHRRALYVLPEQMPSLRQLRDMSGCNFAPRCPVASEECRQSDPPNAAIANRHIAACIRPALAPQIKAQAELPAASSSAEQCSMPLLRIERLEKRYLLARSIFGTATETIAVSNADVAIAEDEFVGLVGESGSGKSTLAKLILGLERPSDGRIMLNGEDVTRPSARARALRIATLAMVFQDPQSALNPRRRIASIVTQAMEAARSHIPWQERIARAKVLLADMGISPDLATAYPAQLSGGQLQRINIARALCNVPKLLVADEILSGLDVSIQAQLLHLLVRLRSEFGFAMLLISHDLSVIRHLCTRVLVMYRGEIVEQGATEEVFNAPKHPHTCALLAAVPPDATAA
jgi:oligopeptide/dipeptide ABC transporter ATP-binding protein